MKRIFHINVAFAVALTLALTSITMAAPKSERTRKRLTIEGSVLQVNTASRTLLVSDVWSKKLYSVQIPEGAAFSITFGQNARNSTPEFRDVHRGDRVRMRCTRNTINSAHLGTGGEIVTLVAVR